MDEAFPDVPQGTLVSGVVYLFQTDQAILTVSRGQVIGIITNAELMKLGTRLA